MKRTPNFYRVMLGEGSKYADTSISNGFMAVGFLDDEDLTPYLENDAAAFHKEVFNLDQEIYPEASRGSSGRTAGIMRVFCKEIEIGDYILSPDGDNNYVIGKVTGEYRFAEEDKQQHQRKVDWNLKKFSKDNFSDDFLASARASGTIVNLSPYSQEIFELLDLEILESPSAQDDRFRFQFEKELQNFLGLNWGSTALGKIFDIYEEGVEFPTDTGSIDILAISKDKKEFLVIELKRGEASDDAIGQLLRYMAFIKNDLADDGQTVRGCVIAKKFNEKFKRAVSMVDTISHYSFEVSFKLVEQE